MWSVGSKGCADVYVGTRRVLYVPAGVRSGDESHADAQSWSVEGFDDALRVLDEQVLTHQSSTKNWRIWLSAGIARPFLLEAPAKTSHSELRQIAEALVLDRVGIADECELWVEPARGANAVIAVAIVKSQLEELLGRFAKGTGHRLLSLAPWWSDALRAALKSEAEARLVVVQDCDSLTLLSGQSRLFDGVQTLSPVYDRATADAALARKRLALDVREAEVIQFRLGTGVAQREDSTVQAVDLALAPFVGSLG